MSNGHLVPVSRFKPLLALNTSRILTVVFEEIFREEAGVMNVNYYSRSANDIVPLWIGGEIHCPEREFSSPRKKEILSDFD